jgi:steroid 5-alpha reductase family enzyme
MTETVAVGPRRPLSRTASFAVVGAAYLVASAVAIGIGRLVGGHPLTVVAVGMGAAALTIFGFSRALNNTSMFDAYWSVAPPVVALYLLAVSEPGVPAVRQAVVTALVFAWGVRLTANWARSWPGLDHEDWRYVEMRTNGRPYWPQSLVGLHLFPAVQVYLGCLALYPALAVGTDAVGLRDGVAALVTAAAITLEAVADEQLRAFNRTKASGDVCDVGVWAWSRHPNYLGEISFWWGLWLFGLAADPGWWWTMVGPLAMTVMFVAASIPLLERRSAERRSDWEAYRSRTPVLVPRPPGPPA